MRLIDADALDYGFPFTDDVYGLSRQIGIELVKARIAEAPTIEAEPVRHGRWELEHETWGELRCSVCKKEALLEKSNGDVGTILLYVTSNYCPNCGAKMDGERRESDE